MSRLFTGLACAALLWVAQPAHAVARYQVVSITKVSDARGTRARIELAAIPEGYQHAHILLAPTTTTWNELKQHQVAAGKIAFDLGVHALPNPQARALDNKNTFVFEVPYDGQRFKSGEKYILAARFGQHDFKAAAPGGYVHVYGASMTDTHITLP
jgi:hypothetical protein